MAYQGSAAYRLDANQEVWEVPARRSLQVMEGGGLDARARAGVTPGFVTLARLAALFVVLFMVFGAVRVTLTTATVSCLREVSTVETQVSEARNTRTELQVERSVLSSVDRIQRIATENYGMVYATDVDTISVRDEYLKTASADDAQMANDAGEADSIA